jgi:predicted RNA-binding protein
VPIKWNREKGQEQSAGKKCALSPLGGESSIMKGQGEILEEDVLKISVAGHTVGVAGLKDIFRRAKESPSRTEGERETFLLEEAKKKNFIPAKAEGEYARALSQEFRRYMGENVKEKFSVLQVRVLGMGCVTCQKLAQETVTALAELDLAADFDRIQDIREFAKYGIRGTPALVINGKVKAAGRVPPRGEIKKWLQEGQNKK